MTSSPTAPQDPAEAENSLLIRARDGEAGAFEELMRTHERFVYGLALRRLAVREDARDAAQEVFLRLYRHLDRIDPRRPLAAWLYRVTVNVCNDQGRARSRRESELPEGAEQIPDGDPAGDPSRRLEDLDRRRMIRQGLRRLSESEREALILRDVEGLSTRETAAALSTSETTVRTHICRGRRKLAEFRERWNAKNESGKSS